MSYNLNRKMEAARAACQHLVENFGATEFRDYADMIDNFDQEKGKDAMMQLQQEVDELMITENYMVMKPLHM